jgi:hypothetical protein
MSIGRDGVVKMDEVELENEGGDEEAVTCIDEGEESSEESVVATVTAAQAAENGLSSESLDC